jgi:CrcB protein
MSYFWIFLGGGLGSITRFAGSDFIARQFGDTFPRGTLLVNVTGSFSFVLCMVAVWLGHLGVASFNSPKAL